MADTPHTAYIGLGSNLADPLEQVQRAVQALDDCDDLSVQDVSPWYGSQPMGGPKKQPPFVNGVARLDIRLKPWELLAECNRIERDFGRVWHERWGNRVIDLDILLYDNLQLRSRYLSLPHPGICKRQFVLQPLLCIAPDLCLPDGTVLRSLLRRDLDSCWPINMDDMKKLQDGAALRAAADSRRPVGNLSLAPIDKPAPAPEPAPDSAAPDEDAPGDVK